MQERSIDDLELTEAMEDMLIDALLFGGGMLKGVTNISLRARGLSAPASAGNRRELTALGREVALHFAREDAESGALTVQILRDLASVANLPLSADGEALVEYMNDRAAADADRRAERGAGCTAGCGCGA